MDREDAIRELNLLMEKRGTPAAVRVNVRAKMLRARPADVAAAHRQVARKINADRGGNPLPALGRIRLDIVIPVKWRNGPFRELKLWFVDQYDRQFHGGALAKTQRHSKMLAEKACHAREDTARVA